MTTQQVNGFDVIFHRVMLNEGGSALSLVPEDDGNWTGGKKGVGELKGSKYGVSAAAYPHLDIANLSEEAARAIVYEDFYLPASIDQYSDAMRYQMMDAAYNHGLHNAIKIYQRAVGVKDDGVIGSKTRTAAQQQSENDRLLNFMACRFEFWASCKTFNKFGAGWVRRGAQCLRYAAQDNND